MSAEEQNKMRRIRYIIHLDHRSEASGISGKLSKSDGSITFATESEFRDLAGDWPGQRFVEVWNQLPQAKKVSKFKDRKSAIRRIWKALRDLKPYMGASLPVDADKITKAERITALLKSPSGASLRAIMALTGWQSHSVRGFISGQLTKRMGFKIQSFKRNGERVYRIRP
jgi:hypothetical protein